MNIKTCLSSAVLLMLGAAVSPLAGAAPIKAANTSTHVNVAVGPLDTQFISETVDVRGPRTLVIHYFAECQVERGHVEYDIVVQRTGWATTALSVVPTDDNGSALCSNDGDTTESNMRAKSVGTVVVCNLMSAGDYTIKVRGHVEALTMPGPGVVDEQSLVIEAHELSVDDEGIYPCIFELPIKPGTGG